MADDHNLSLVERVQAPKPMPALYRAVYHYDHQGYNARDSILMINTNLNEIVKRLNEDSKRGDVKDVVIEEYACTLVRYHEWVPLVEGFLKP